MPAAPAPTAAPAAVDKGESIFKIKLKPAPAGDRAEPPARSGVAEGTPVGVAGIGAMAAGLSLPAGPGIKKMPTLRSTEPPVPPKQDRRATLGIGLLLLILAGACIYWFFFRKPAHTPAAAPVVTSPPAAPKPVAPVTVEPQPRLPEPVASTLPDHALVSGESPVKTTAGAAAAAGVIPPAPSTTPAAVSLPPIATPEPAGPSPQFRAFVDHLKISGVRTGPPARLFVDGVACRPGDAMDRELGVIFVGVDGDAGEIVFKDATGAIARRRY